MTPFLTKSLGFRISTMAEGDEAVYSYAEVTSSRSPDNESRIIADTMKEEESYPTGGIRVSYPLNKYLSEITDVKSVQKEPYENADYLLNLTEEIPEQEPVPKRGAEMEWISSHYSELIAYEGQWIVVEGKQLITHDFDFAKAVSEARSKGVEIPYITKVVVEKETPFVG